MAQSIPESGAVVLLPATGQELAKSERRWLARGRMSSGPSSGLPLLPILAALEVPAPEEGLAALRLWGQTRQRPAGWIAAADPVFLQAGMQHLFLHALPASELPERDVAEVFACLQESLAAERPFRFAAEGACGYLHREQAMGTAAVPPSLAEGHAPADFLPRDAREHDRLQGEVQMCLHQSPVNERRESLGLRPINALWFWGGGRAPEASPGEELPPLYAGDALSRGYWASRGAASADFTGFDACLRSSPEGFVAIIPDTGSDAGESANEHLHALRRILQGGSLQRLVLLFRDGLRVELRRSDRWRWWRRDSGSWPGATGP